MPRTFFLLLASLIYTCSFSQVSITGKVVDTNHQPLPYATVLLLHINDSSVVKGVTTEMDGAFSIERVNTGTYALRVRMVGFKGKTITVDALFNLFLEPIVLDTESQLLEEVTVVGEKPFIEQHVDKLVVNVQNSVVSAGGNVLEILGRSPGVSVNKESGSMSMNGKQGIQVLINGKLQRLPLAMVMQQLEGIASSNVEKIELISNPSSRYDAEGDAGIINIITKRSTDIGTSGNATIGMGHSAYSDYWKPNTSLGINHKRDDFALTASYSLNIDRRWQQWNYERQVIDPDLYSNTTTDRHILWPIQRASLGAEWNVSSQTTINSLVSGFSDMWKMESYNKSTIRSKGVDSAAIHLYDREKNHWKHLMGNVNVNHRFNNNSKLNIDADYLYYHDDNPNFFINDYTFHESGLVAQEQIRTSKKTPINMGVLKIDYERQFQWLKMELGIKSTFSRLENDVKLEKEIAGTWIADDKFSHNYFLRDDLNAAYITASGNSGSKGKFQLGLRAESTDMQMMAAEEKIYDLYFWKLFPTFFYSWQSNTENSWQFSYGKRITRPAYTSVAPFVILMDPFTYYWGNLSLKPAISNTLQVSFLHKDLQLSLKYSHDKNAIAGNQSRYNDAEKKTYIYADNIDKLQLYSFSATLPVELLKWWKTQNSALLTYQKTDHLYKDTPLSFQQFSARLSTIQSFTLPNNFVFELTGIYVAPRRIGLSLLKTVIEVSAGLQKKFNDKSKLSLTITDIFWTRNSVYVSSNLVLGQIQKTSYYNEPRVIRLSYSLYFGNSKVNVSKSRSTASEAEQQE